MLFAVCLLSRTLAGLVGPGACPVLTLTVRLARLMRRRRGLGLPSPEVLELLESYKTYSSSFSLMVMDALGSNKAFFSGLGLGSNLARCMRFLMRDLDTRGCQPRF